MFISTGGLGYAHRSRRRGNEHKYRNDEEDDNEKNLVVGSIGMHDDPPLFGTAKPPAKDCYFSLTREATLKRRRGKSTSV